MDMAHEFTDAEIKKIERSLIQIYGQAQKDIEKKMEEFNRKFKIKDAIHRKELEDGKISKADYDSWVRGQVFQGKQWEQKRAECINVVENANARAIAVINGKTRQVFGVNGNYIAYSLEHQSGVNFGFDLYDANAVNRLVVSNPQLLPKWKVDKAKDYIWNAKNVKLGVTQGIIQGEGIDAIAKRIAAGLAMKNGNKSKTFARTAMTGAQNAGRQMRLTEAKNKGIKVVKEWMATLDGHTRSTHRMLDGQQVPPDKPFKVDGWEIEYPGDPKARPELVYNCRCTMVGDLEDYPAEYERYDNIDGKPIKNMTYQEWASAKGITPSKPANKQFNQVGIGLCKTVEEVNDLLNSNNLWRGNAEADLIGCDLDSAKSIAASYEQVFVKYPQLKGRFAAPDAHPSGMKNNTYAWCYTKTDGKVQVNPKKYSNWSSVQRQYERDVEIKWHPYGTTAESIVTHEIGHAIDGLLAREGILGGVTASGEYRYASSSLKNTVMKRAAKKDDDLYDLMYNSWNNKQGMEKAIYDYVSEYATKNNREWFAECFAEYITSANPRVVATEFGQELEKLLGRLE